MLTYKKLIFSAIALLLAFSACNGTKKDEQNNKKPLIAKGLYSFGPEVKSFIDCNGSKEYWVVDSAETLELAYQNLGFEKPYTPVYVEVEYHHVKSDSLIAADYDSTMVVTKLLKISQQIPEGPCSQ
jgi:copper homeostasis protein (lipoprotein)